MKRYCAKLYYCSFQTTNITKEDILKNVGNPTINGLP